MDFNILYNKIVKILINPFHVHKKLVHGFEPKNSKDYGFEFKTSQSQNRALTTS